MITSLTLHSWIHINTHYLRENLSKFDYFQYQTLCKTGLNFSLLIVNTSMLFMYDLHSKRFFEENIFYSFIEMNFNSKIELSNQKTFLLPAGFELWTLLLVFDANTLTNWAIAHSKFKLTTLMWWLCVNLNRALDWITQL